MSVAAPLGAQGLQVVLGGRRVLAGVSLALRPGERAVLVGPNGAGKSTLLSALAGLQPLQAGTVLLEGRALAAWPARERALRLAWLAQQGEVPAELTALDVVRLGRLPHHGLLGATGAADDAAVARALEACEAQALAPRRLSALSGGERQRVLLARALAVEAPVLLLDEPTTHLDPPHQRALWRALAARAQQGAAVLAVLHDLQLALAAERVLVLRDGVLVADGAPADAALRAALEAAFDHAFSLHAVPTPGGLRWVAVPHD